MKNKKYIIIAAAVAVGAIGLFLALLTTGDKLFRIPTDYDRIVVVRRDSNEIRYPEDGEKMEDGSIYPHNQKTMYTATGDEAKQIVDYINNAKYLRRKSINVFTFVPGISMDSVKTSDRVEYYIAFEAADGTELYTMVTAGDDYIHGGEENATHKKIIDRKWGPNFDTVLQNVQQQESYWSPASTWFKEIRWAD